MSSKKKLMCPVSSEKDIRAPVKGLMPSKLKGEGKQKTTQPSKFKKQKKRHNPIDNKPKHTQKRSSGIPLSIIINNKPVPIVKIRKESNPEGIQKVLKGTVPKTPALFKGESPALFSRNSKGRFSPILNKGDRLVRTQCHTLRENLDDTNQTIAEILDFFKAL